MQCAILMSGTGSNAVALIEYERRFKNPPYRVAALITDAPETSKTREIAEKYNLPWAGCDIRKFYAAHGEESTKLDSEKRRLLRDEWSMELLQTVRSFDVDFALFAGFVPLTNIASHIPCLNVHPGDLTRYDENGERIYAGLHVLPVEKALLNGEKYLRSSVILVQAYSGSGHKDIDAGPVLGVSAPLMIDYGKYTPEDLLKIREKRTPGVKCHDPLRMMALEHIEKLKVAGDHVVFPQAAADFASGVFEFGEKDFRYKGTDVLSVEYSSGSAPLPIIR